MLIGSIQHQNHCGDNTCDLSGLTPKTVYVRTSSARVAGLKHQRNWVKRAYSAEYPNAQQMRPITRSWLCVLQVVAISTGTEATAHMMAPVTELLTRLLACGNSRGTRRF